MRIPAQRNALGNEEPVLIETLKEFANSPNYVTFNHNPFRVGTNPCGSIQGSALARATLGCELVTPSAFSVRIVTNLWSRQVDTYRTFLRQLTPGSRIYLNVGNDSPRPFLAGQNGLTPPDPCDNLATQVADFRPHYSELYLVPHCFSSSECRSATQWKSQSWIRPTQYPEENSD